MDMKKRRLDDTFNGMVLTAVIAVVCAIGSAIWSAHGGDDAIAASVVMPSASATVALAVPATTVRR